MGRLTGIDIEGDVILRKALDQYPDAVLDATADEITKYLQNILRTYPPKNYITRQAAYGQTFQSDKQRRWFFANLNEGNISVPYKRTQGLARSWRIVGSGVKSIIISESEAAHWTMSESQSRHERLVGWKQIGEIVAERASKLNDIFVKTSGRIMKKLGLK